MAGKKTDKNDGFVASGQISDIHNLFVKTKKKKRGGFRPDRRIMSTGGIKVQIGGKPRVVYRDDEG